MLGLEHPLASCQNVPNADVLEDPVTPQNMTLYSLQQLCPCLCIEWVHASHDAGKGVNSCKG